ncbi:hypothetical protein HUG20_06820 [Salicibibacter cibi]|uniref:Uncharacterized protein n=1 Tax=Salicibibacter cibi TaxID=2743001 RepID=A0A7T6ZA99_9BACI|nr:hypothetical protein [Salicibibacter cibi]QQK79617.1 hypothetical protein HUG20_06820 [Salicibibacter cibi]
MKENESIAWHPSFAAALQLELQAYAGELEFLEEYQLTSEPLKVDVLILKDRQMPIHKNIGKSFGIIILLNINRPEIISRLMTFTRQWHTCICIKTWVAKAQTRSMSAR